MKKFTLAFIVLIIAFAASATAQIKESPKPEPEQVGSYRMGVIKLYKVADTFEIKGLVKQDVATIMTVSLGTKEQAVAIIQSMLDYSGKETVPLNNPSDNIARNMGAMMGGWEIGITQMFASSIMVSKGELKKMLKAINE